MGKQIPSVACFGPAATSEDTTEGHHSHKRRAAMHKYLRLYITTEAFATHSSWQDPPLLHSPVFEHQH